MLALSHLESSSISTQSNRYGLSLPANVRDVRPPPGVSTACLDSIELTFTVQALLPSPASPVKNRGRNDARERKNGNNARYALRLRNAISYGEDSTSSPLLPAKNEEVVHEDILLLSPRCDMPTHDTEMLELNEDHSDMLLYPDPKPMPAIPNVPLPQYAQPPQPPPRGPLSVLKLVDASLRHTISGTSAPSKTTKKGAPSDVRLMKTSPSLSLADISPALFRPGYLKVIPPASLPFPSQSITLELAVDNQYLLGRSRPRSSHLTHRFLSRNHSRTLPRPSTSFRTRTLASLIHQRTPTPPLAPPTKTQMAHHPARTPELRRRERFRETCT